MKTERVRCPGSKRWMPQFMGRETGECPECGQTVRISIVSELWTHHTGKRERVLRAVATRQRRVPPLLHGLAAAAGMTPTEYVVEILSRHATNEDAAASIGVSRNTLWRWSKRLGVGVIYKEDES